MIKFRMYSKLYDDAKAQWDRRDDYEIAEIAKENSKLKGQILGAGLGLAVSALSRKKLKGLMSKHPKFIKKIEKVDPGVLDTLTSNLTVVPATLAGSHYGGEITGNAAKKVVLKEIEDKRNNKYNRLSRYV